MSTLVLPQPRRRRAVSLSAVRALAQRPELLVLLAITGALNLWALDLNGSANDYYAAAVRSMTTSWHAFFYGSYDIAGLQTVDKPPLALWVQALSARAFGFNSWSLLVPQALMGVATVGLVYDLTVKRFGRGAAFVAGLALALTPITVAISRHNNPDALLVLCITAAVWATDRGLRAGGNVRWLLAAGAFVGLGFETKMAAALLVVPGIVAAWLWVAPRGRLRAFGQVLAGGAAMTVVGLAWPLLMWLTPASSRPYIAGTDDNSIWSLILGYNGLGRLFGQSGGPGGGMGGGAGGVFGGSAGPARLLNQALGGQAGWLLGFAIAAGLALIVATRLRRNDARTGWLIAVGGAFLVSAITFSRAAGIFHPYYTAALAPFTALLVGAGWAQLRHRAAGPLILAAGALTEAVVIANSATDLSWATGLIIAAGVAAAAGIALASSQRVRTVAAAAGVTVLLLAPASWAVQTLGHATSSTFPAGGPSAAQTMGGGGGPGAGGPGAAGGFRGGTPPADGTTGGTATGGTGGSTAGGTGGSTAGGSTAGGTGGSTAARGSTAAGSTAGGSTARGTGGSTAGGSTAGGTGGSTAGGSTAGGTAGSAAGTATGGATAGGTTGSSTGTTSGGPGGGGGAFGGDTSELNAALAYAKANGGGTVVISSQSGASQSIIQSGADVAAIGGFSGSETVVTKEWLADAVESGRIRWVLVSGTASGMRDGRTGASDAMALAAEVGKAVSSVSGLYDLQGTADAIRAAS